MAQAFDKWKYKKVANRRQVVESYDYDTLKARSVELERELKKREEDNDYDGDLLDQL